MLYIIASNSFTINVFTCKYYSSSGSSSDKANSTSYYTQTIVLDTFTPTTASATATIIAPFLAPAKVPAKAPAPAPYLTLSLMIRDY